MGSENNGVRPPKLRKLLLFIEKIENKILSIKKI
jgi:hypothetical protein